MATRFDKYSATKIIEFFFIRDMEHEEKARLEEEIRVKQEEIEEVK